jgi:hypothetical protein
MKILLDIDGVMVSGGSWLIIDRLEDGFYKFKDRSVKTLNELIEKHNADIVLTTSHRGRFTIEEWVSMFETRGIIVNNLDKIEDNYLSRKENIIKWVNENDGEYIIIDDDKRLNSLPLEIKENLILTKSIIGL